MIVANTLYQIESFIMKLDVSLNLQYFRTFSGSTNGYASSLMTDGSTGVYAHIKEL